MNERTSTVAAELADETHARPSAQIVLLQELPPAAPSGPPLAEGRLALIEGVKVRVDARLGSADISVSELFALKRDSVLALDTALDAPVELRLGDKVVALGQLVAVGEQFGLRITDIHSSPPAEKRS